MQIAKHRKAKKVQEALGSNFTVLEFDQPTASALQAATAIGCAVAQIAKSLVFADAKDAPVLVIASGASRVDEAKVGEILGTPIHRADANFVKSATGFSIGGVPPVGHAKRPFVLLDRDLEGFTQIWAAAGTPNAVFKLTPIQLKQLTGGVYYDIKWIEVY